MNPYIDIQNNPHVQIKVNGNNEFVVDCFIDTGFTGGIVLPVEYKKYFSEKPNSMQRFLLANGSLMPVELYKIQIVYKNTKKTVSGFFTKGKEVLVGIEFLTDFKFTLDLRKLQIGLE